jgi:hypothetical protein
MVCPARHARLFSHLLSCLHDTLLDGCHLEVISVGSGCHVAENNHLVTLGLDTALSDDLRRREVVRWSLGGVFCLRRTRQACRGSLEACFRGNLDLARLSFPAREVFP